MPKRKSFTGKVIKKNYVEQHVAKYGFREFRPSDEIMMKMGISEQRWKKILKNEVDMTATEIYVIAEWLKITRDEIFISLRTIYEHGKKSTTIDNKTDMQVENNAEMTIEHAAS